MSKTKLLTDKTLKVTLKACVKADWDRRAAALELGIARATVDKHVRQAVERGLIEQPATRRNTKNIELPVDMLQDIVNAAVQHPTGASAARSLGMKPATFRARLAVADQRGITATIRGETDAVQPTPLPLPEKGQVKRYILTCAQNDTLIHDSAWRALTTLADHYGAEMKVATLTYVHSQGGSAKRGSNKSERGHEMWYDTRIEPYVCDDIQALAPTLIWNGNMNIIPTAVDPLSGLDNYNFRNSSVFPHVKVAMKSVPTINKDAAKLQYTTGTITKRNYLQKKSGQKAEFDHVYGGLLVEVDHTGQWWARQLNVDERGGLYDLNVYVTPRGTVEPSKGVEAIQFGDVHVAQLESDMEDLTWGEGGMVDVLRPRRQFMHDILDFESRSHHNMRDPFKMFQLHSAGKESVEDEIKGVGALLKRAARKGCELIIVQSNHDLHFERWLREGTWKTDPVNALTHSKATTAFLTSITKGQSFNALRWALAEFVGKGLPKLTWADPDDGFLILRNKTGGLEMGLHGDCGPNGARGSLRNLARIGRKVCIGHSHSAGIYNGAWQSGVKATMRMGYASGSPSSWTQSDIIVQPNGKRQMITWWKGRYCA